MPRRSKRNSRNDDEEVENGDQVENEITFEEEGNANDDDEQQQQQQRKKMKKTKSGKKQNKVKVMGSSGQTDADRRVLRKNQRDLHDKMTDGTLDVADSMADVNGQAFQKIRCQNNSLWDQVKYTREGVLDGENMKLITDKALMQVDQLMTTARYDATRLVTKLRSKCSLHTNSSTAFDWKNFGLEVGSCFNSVPSYCSFLNGPIDTAYTPKERKKPVRRVVEEDDAEEEEVGTVNQKSKSKDENKLSAVEKQLKVLNKTLKRRDGESREQIIDLALKCGGKLPEDMRDDEKKKFMKRVKKSAASRPCAVQFVMNPKSFTQTVENIFGLSFMVKKGDAEIGVRTFEDCQEADLGTIPGPWVKRVKSDVNIRRPQPSARQAIISFNMQDWRDLREAYNIEQGDIAHRGKSRQARASKS